MPEIKSNPDPESPRPWFDYDVDATNLTAVFTEANGLAAAPWTNADETAQQALLENSRHGLSLSSEKPDERHVLAVTIDGDVEFVPASEQRSVYYAHLGEYDPATGEFTGLTFVEG